ncbi:MAG: O-antigen translocase, partial [Bacteroidota bacterium]
MIKILDKIKSSQLFSVSLYTGISTAIKLLTGFVTAKVIAVHIGPQGIGVLGQLLSFLAIVMPLSIGATGNGVIKYLAEYTGKSEAQNKVLKASLVITCFCSLLISLILILGASNWSLILFDSDNYTDVIAMLGFTLVFYAAFTLGTSILNGLKEYKRFNYANISASIFGLIFSYVLMVNYGIKGALLATVTYQSVVFIVLFFFLRNVRQFNFMAVYKARPAKRIYYNLFQYSLMAIISAATVPVAQIIIRKYIVSHVSDTAMGFYEGINRLSGLYMSIIVTVLSVYYLPKLSEITNSRLLRREIFKGYRIILPATFVLLIAIYFLKDLVITIVFSETFREMNGYFLPQIAGDFFKIASWLLAFNMLAKAMTKLYIITEVVFTGTLIMASVLFVDTWGAVGAVYAY